MPMLRVSMWTGRSKEKKAEMAKVLTDAMVRVAQVRPEAVTIIFEELPQENWATGGRLHTELFKQRG